MAAASSLRMWGDSGQPRWLHSPSICAHPQVDMRRGPISVNPALLFVAPIEKHTAIARRKASAVLIQKTKEWPDGFFVSHPFGARRRKDGAPMIFVRVKRESLCI